MASDRRGAGLEFVLEFAFCAASNTTTAGRLAIRCASFCTGRWRGVSNATIGQDQELVSFLPNMSWLQPPGHLHAMLASSFRERALPIGFAHISPPLPPAAAASTAVPLWRQVSSVKRQVSPTHQVPSASCTPTVRTLRSICDLTSNLARLHKYSHVGARRRSRGHQTLRTSRLIFSV